MSEPQYITIDEWRNQNIVPQDSFEEIGADHPVAKKYPLHPIQSSDLFFTYEIEDDGVNTTAILSDYDWMTYRYDTRFPTKNNGTLAVRFEYVGMTDSDMHVKQFLPFYLTKESKNYVVNHRFTFSTKLFEKFFAKELQARLDNLKGTYAYNADDIMLEWFNAVLKEGKPSPAIPISDMHWTSVRIPKETESITRHLQSHRFC